MDSELVDPHHNTLGSSLLVDLGEQLVVPEQAQLLLSNLDGASSKLWDQDFVAGLHTRCYALAVLVECAGAHGEHFCFVELFYRGFGEEDACCCLGFGLDALHEDAVEERGNALD